MADPDPVRIKPHLTLIGLQIKLRNVEALLLKVTGLDTDATDTIAIVADGVVPARSLKLFLDPAGNLAPPNGTVLICRGKAFVQGNEQKVAAVR